MSQGYQALTEKEKETLRLVVRGYDAKSMARHLGLSVHTINERLRFARRKMEVSSSREAARLLLDREEDDPDSLADKQMGEAGAARPVRQARVPDSGSNLRPGLTWLIGGICIMSLVIAALAIITQPQAPVLQAGLAEEVQAGAPVAASTVENEAVAAARSWLRLVDQYRWADSWNATGAQFRDLNSVDLWTSVSEDVRVPLGAVTSRAFTSVESVPAPPHGFEMVKFRTSFEGLPDTVETLTLVREGDAWRVVGYIIG